MLITIDDSTYFENVGLFYISKDPTDISPVYGHADRDNLWGVLLEKAWSKISGNYLNTKGGYT